MRRILVGSTSLITGPCAAGKLAEVGGRAHGRCCGHLPAPYLRAAQCAAPTCWLMRTVEQHYMGWRLICCGPDERAVPAKHLPVHGPHCHVYTCRSSPMSARQPVAACRAATVPDTAPGRSRDAGVRAARRRALGGLRRLLGREPRAALHRLPVRPAPASRLHAHWPFSHEPSAPVLHLLPGRHPGSSRPPRDGISAHESACGRRSRVIITASGSMRGAKRVDLKTIVDAAAAAAAPKGHKARTRAPGTQPERVVRKGRREGSGRRLTLV